MPLLILLLILLMPSLAQATVYWDEEFVNLSAWDTSSGGSGVFNIDSSIFISGTTSLRLDYPSICGSNSVCGGGIFRTYTDSSTLYARYYIRLSAGFQVSVPDFTKIHYFGTDMVGADGQRHMVDIATLGQNNQVYQYHVQNSPIIGSTRVLATSAQLPNNATWHCVEEHIQLNTPGTANGVYEMWLDGTLAGSYSDVIFRTAGDNSLFQWWELYRQNGVGSIWFDKVAVGSTRFNDCPGAVVDTTPPTQVTGFSVSAPSASSLFITATNGTDNIDIGLNLRLERCTVTSVNPCTSFSLISTIGATGGSITTQTDGGLAASTTFCYRANNQDGSGNQGPYSATACGTTAASTSMTRRTLGSDTFNRANNADIGAAWDNGYTGGEAAQIVSNAVEATTVGGFAAESLSTAVPNDQWIEWTFLNLTGTQGKILQLNVRETAPATTHQYGCQVGAHTANSSTLFKFDGITETDYATSNTETYISGDRIRCEIQGTSLSLYHNDVLVLNATTDGAYTSGRVGFTLSTASGGALTDNVIDNVSWGDYIVAVQPTITNAITDSTGSTLTSGGSTPSFLRVQTNATNLFYTWNDGIVMVAGRYTQPGGGWDSSLTYVCFFAQDGNHVESSNSADWQCDSLVGLTMTQDTTPPVLSGASPSGTLAQGTTSTTISMVSDELADLKYSTTDIAYASMASSMTTVDGLHHSATVTGLTDGASKTYYVRGQDRSTSLNQDTTSTLISFQVGIAVDTIPPILSGGAPSGVLPAGTTSVSMSVNTNENSTCKYGTIAGTAYASIAGTFTTGNGTLIHSQTISGLTNGNTYTEYIRCTDGSNANTSDYVITWSITALPPDVTPPVRSAGAPSGVKVSGTTSVSMTLTTSENSTCKYGIAPGVAYASIANTFSTTGTTSHSQTIGSLIDGQISTYFIRCRDAALNANPDDYIITWSVAVANDATPPTAPTNLVCTAFISSQASCTFTPGTDAVGVVSNVATIGVSSGGNCTSSLIVNPGWGTSSPQPLINLTGNVTYCVTMQAKDLAGNLSSASNTSTFTTPPLGDPIPPSDVTGLLAPPATVLVNSITLNWDTATDNVSVTGYIVYRCEVGIDCPNFIIKFSTPANTLTDTLNLKPITEYHYIVYANDGTNVSVNPSNEISVMTPALPAGTTQANCPCRTRTH